MRQMSVILLVFGFFLVACGGGGRGRVAGAQCPRNYKPLTMEFNPDQQKDVRKIEWDQASQLPDGLYEYQGANLFYEEPSGFMIYVSDVLSSKSNTFEPIIRCVRNATQSLGNLSVITEGVTQMSIESGKNLIDTKLIGFEEANGLKAVAKPNLGGKDEAPGKIYEKTNLSYMLALPNDIYEIRSSSQDELGTYILVIRLKRKDAAKPGLVQFGGPR